MSETLPFSSCFKLLSSTTRTVPVITRQLQFTNLNGVSVKREFWGCQLPRKSHLIGDKINGCRAEASLQEVNGVDDSPVSVDLEPICSEMQFDGVIAQAQRLEESIIVVWVARWCRKCIYLKPKLEKLAAEYYPRLRFYCVDVNNVPHKLVARAGVTRMPTIQLWKDGKKQAEVIGGHKAYLVINEVREMIENESNTDL